LASAKFELGNEWLAGPVFTAAFGKETVDRIAAYVATGGFYGDLGALAQENPDVIKAVLSFRKTREGSNLREAVLANLAMSDGGEVVAAINGRLSDILPLSTLEKAKSKFSQIYVPNAVRDLPAGVPRQRSRTKSIYVLAPALRRNPFRNVQKTANQPKFNLPLRFRREVQILL